MDFGKLVFFAIALSLDAFSAGFAYGLRRIKIPLVSYCALICASMLIVGLSVFCGSAVAHIIPDLWGEKLGGIILLGIGLWWLFRPRKKNKNINQEEEKVKKVVELRLASLAVIIQIFEEPAYADIDASGVISIQESLFLAFALSVDALGAVLEQHWPVQVGFRQFCSLLFSAVLSSLGGLFRAHLYSSLDAHTGPANSRHPLVYAGNVQII